MQGDNFQTDLNSLARCPLFISRTHENRELIREQEGLAPIIRLIASTSPGLLVNVAAAIGQMAEDVESLEQVGGVVDRRVD